MKQFSSAWDTLMAKLSMTERPVDKVLEKDYFDLVEEARLEWQAAITYFNNVVDPDLIDHAIHVIQAAEKKYTYLLKKANLEGYRLPAKLDALRGGR
jgi:hypothetical protein